MRDIIKNLCISVDYDGIAQECIEMDGYGHFIAGYDGVTIELDEYYAYLQDTRDERE